jgi:hypothetical protein
MRKKMQSRAIKLPDVSCGWRQPIERAQKSPR